MLERVKHENTVDIYGHVTVLRTQRNFMVQKEVSRRFRSYLYQKRQYSSSESIVGNIHHYNH